MFGRLFGLDAPICKSLVSSRSSFEYVLQLWKTWKTVVQVVRDPAAPTVVLTGSEVKPVQTIVNGNEEGNKNGFSHFY